MPYFSQDNEIKIITDELPEECDCEPELLDNAIEGLNAAGDLRFQICDEPEESAWDDFPNEIREYRFGIWVPIDAWLSKYEAELKQIPRSG